MTTQELNYEKAMARLEEIVGLLESGRMGLQESLGLFKEGAELTAYCSGVLQSAKLQIEELFPQKEGEDIGL